MVELLAVGQLLQDGPRPRVELEVVVVVWVQLFDCRKRPVTDFII
jgi:hypothetical protein